MGTGARRTDGRSRKRRKNTPRFSRFPSRWPFIDRPRGDPVRAVYCSTINHVRFTWDPRKAASNLKKHGVSFPEAATAFEDKLGAYYPDTVHEDRFILIGYSSRQRLLYVVHAEVREDVVRIISARRATRHEKAHYEND